MLACRCAKEQGIQHIIFGGSFIRDHPFTIATISSGVHFFSQGSMQESFRCPMGSNSLKRS